VRVALVLALAACRADAPPTDEARRAPVEVAPDPYAEKRLHMVEDTLVARGIEEPHVLAAMNKVPRHELVPPNVRDQAYADRALPIGFGLTISQPFIVATMTQAADIKPGDRVLEIGTGSGYQAAVLAEIGARVYTIEIVDELAARTRGVLAHLGYDAIQLRVGDGYRGWPEAGPFDAIIVTAAAPEVPKPLLDQLAFGGRMVIPLGDDDQYLTEILHLRDRDESRVLMPVRFGKMTGEAQRVR
jgi:protein-L-isoaspartate(D-aspartate) O-methyltransferase